MQRRVLRDHLHAARGALRRQDVLDESTTADLLTWQGTGGLSIDASVRIEEHSRHSPERLVRGHRGSGVRCP